jgi:hypothetical protein
MPKQQRARTPKTSKGIHGGAKKVRLDEVTKVLLGGGCLAAVGNKRTKRARKHLIAKKHDIYPEYS